MSDQTSFYLLNVRKLLGKQPPTPTNQSQPAEESVEYMLKYLSETQTQNQPNKRDRELEALSQQMQHQSSPAKLFAKEKYDRLGYISESKSPSYEKQILQQSESYLQREREKNKLHSQLNQEIMASVSKFDEGLYPFLPLDDINRECQQFPQYLNFVDPVHREITKPSFKASELDSPPKLVIQGYGTKDKQEKIAYDKTIEVQFEQQTEDTIKRDEEKKIRRKVTNVLRKNPKFLKLIGTYIMYFVKQEVSHDAQVNIIDEQQVKAYQVLKDVASPPDSEGTLRTAFQKSVTPLQLRFQISEGERYIPINNKLFQKVANKRNGDSLKFHPKTFIMNGDQLVYHGDDSNMKMLIVKPQVLELNTVEKEIGGFFSRERVDTKSFTVEGEERTLEIEYNELQGSEIFKMMVDYFAMKVYQCFCIHTETIENDFKRFLNHDKCSIWDFTNMNCHDPDIVDYSLPYWFKVLEFKSNLKSISFRNNGMNSETMEYIIKNVYNLSFKSLNNFQICGNQIQNEGLKLYCSCFKKFKDLTKFELSGCNLNTIHIQIIAIAFDELEDRDIHILDLSRNPNAKLRQTSNNVINILKMFKPKIFRINESKLSNEDFVDFINFRFNIIEIEANDCGIEFDDEMIRNIIKEIEINYMLKVITANGNKVTASNEILVELLRKPRLNEIAIDFTPEFFTDIKNPSNEWVIMPL